MVASLRISKWPGRGAFVYRKQITLSESSPNLMIDTSMNGTVSRLVR